MAWPKAALAGWQLVVATGLLAALEKVAAGSRVAVAVKL
jgi:hypothetical protein